MNNGFKFPFDWWTLAYALAGYGAQRAGFRWFPALVMVTAFETIQDVAGGAFPYLSQREGQVAADVLSFMAAYAAADEWERTQWKGSKRKLPTSR